jgi:DNA-binding NtrC family response regulator
LDVKKYVMIVDDDPAFLRITRIFLERQGWTVEAFNSWEEGKAAYAINRFVVLLIDLNVGKHNGLELVQEIKKQNPSQPIILITGHSSIETAVAALRMGVSDYITKPCENEEILIRLENLYMLVSKDEQIQALKNQIAEKNQFHNIITQDEKMMALCELAKTIAATDATMLLQGETGTGKELFAKAIHFESPRNQDPFIVVNCAGVNDNLLESHLFGHVKGAFTGAFETVKGKFEVVGEGSIFLDEVSETSLHFQKKLLRVLQERTFERVGDTKILPCKARIIAGTNKKLKELVSRGEFREDLFFRLNVVPLMIPPLRERKKDIPILALFFLEKFSKKYGKALEAWHPQIQEALLQHAWPGNIRELEHYLEKLTLTSKDGKLLWEQFPLFEESPSKALPDFENISNSLALSFDPFIEKVEHLYFQSLLNRCAGDVAQAALHAKITKKTVYEKIKRYGLKH